MTDNLTGVWDGTFLQPQVGMVTFLATLMIPVARSAET